MDPRFSDVPTLKVYSALDSTTNIGQQLVLSGSLSGVPPTTFANIFALNCVLQRTDAVGIYKNTGTVAVPAWTAL